MSTVIDQTVLSETLEEVVRRLVNLAAPVKIILIGSNARGEAKPDSDLDLLIVEEKVTTQQDEALRLDRALGDLMLPIDLIVVSEAQLNRYSNVPGTIYYHSVREGRVLYARE